MGFYLIDANYLIEMKYEFVCSLLSPNVQTYQM